MAELVNDEVLEEVAGGAGSSAKHAKIINCKNCVNVRSSASSADDKNKIGYAYLGDRYKFYGWSGNWAKIQYGARTGYVFKDFVEIV